MIWSAILGTLFIMGCLLFGYTAEPEIPRWAAIFALASVSVGAIAVSKRVVLGWLDIAVLGLFLWAAASLLWTSDPQGGVYALSRAAALVAVYFGVRYAPEKLIHSIFLWAVPTVILAVVAMMAFQPLYNGLEISYGTLVITIDEHFYAGFWLENFATEFLMVAAPLMLIYMAGGWKSRTFCVAVIMAAWVTAVIMKGFLEYPVFALSLGLIVILGLKIPKWKGALVLAGLAITVGAVSCFMFPEILSSFLVRFQLWINSLYLIADAPIFGHGLASFSGQIDGYQNAHLAIWPTLGDRMSIAGMFAGAAHNEFLQIWAELGIVGVVFAVLILREMLRAEVPSGWRQRWIVMAAYCSILSALALSLLGFPLQQPATALLAAVALGVLARGQAVIVEHTMPSSLFNAAALGVLSKGQIQRMRVFAILRRAVFSSIALALVVSWAWIGSASWQASYHMSMFRAWWDADKFRAASENIAAYNIFPMKQFVRRQLPGSISALSRSRKVDIDHKSADFLYEVGRSAAPYSIDARMARLEYLFNSKRWGEPETDILLAELREQYPNRPRVWIADAFYAAFSGDDTRMRASARMAQHIRPGIEKKPTAFGSLVAAINKESLQ